MPYSVELPNGIVIEGVPDDMPDHEVRARILLEYPELRTEDDPAPPDTQGVGLRADELAPTTATVDTEVPTFSAEDAIDSGLVDESGSLELDNFVETTPEPTAVVPAVKDAIVEDEPVVEEKVVEDKPIVKEAGSPIRTAIDTLKEPVTDVLKELSPAFRALSRDPELTPRQEVVLDIATSPPRAIRGIATDLKNFAAAQGVDSEAYKNLKGIEDFTAQLISARQENNREKANALMQAAEGGGFATEVKGALQAIAADPGMAAEMLGTAIPNIAVSLLGFMAGGAFGPVSAVAGAVTARTAYSTVTGIGMVKSDIYDSVKSVFMQPPYNLSEEEADRKAIEAQEYVGPNLDLILIGGGVNALASNLGLEPAVTKAILGDAVLKNLGKRVIEGAVKEGGPEAAQGAYQKLAQNVALQRAGVDVPTFKGVVGAGTLEGLVGAGVGGGVNAVIATAEGFSEPVYKENVASKRRRAESAARVNSETDDIVIDVEAREVTDRVEPRLEGVEDVSTTDRSQLDEPDTGGDRPSVPLLRGPKDATVSTVSEVEEVDPAGVGPVSLDVDKPSVRDARSDLTVAPFIGQSNINSLVSLVQSRPPKDSDDFAISKDFATRFIQASNEAVVVQKTPKFTKEEPKSDLQSYITEGQAAVRNSKRAFSTLLEAAQEMPAAKEVLDGLMYDISTASENILTANKLLKDPKADKKTVQGFGDIDLQSSTEGLNESTDRANGFIEQHIPSAINQKIIKTASKILSDIKPGSFVEYEGVRGVKQGTVVRAEPDGFVIQPIDPAEAEFSVPKKNVKRATPPDSGPLASDIHHDETGKIMLKSSTNMKQIRAMLSVAMYEQALKGDVIGLVLKEGLQNSKDAVMGAIKAGTTKEGRIVVTLDEDKRLVRIEDNGLGMLPSVINNAFLAMGGTEKPGLTAAEMSGGKGLAKMALFSVSKDIDLETTAVVRFDKAIDTANKENLQKGALGYKNPFIKLDIPKTTTLSDFDPETLFEEERPVPVNAVNAPSNAKNGTDIKFFLADTLEKFGKDEKIEFFTYSAINDLKNTPFLGDIEFVIKQKRSYDEEFETEALPIGKNFPYQDYDAPLEVETDWADIDVYIGKEQKRYPKHSVLSAGVFQFEVTWRTLGKEIRYLDRNGEKQTFPFDVIINIKPKNPASNAMLYPFDMARQNYNKPFEADIKALNRFIVTSFMQENAYADAKALVGSGLSEMSFVPVDGDPSSKDGSVIVIKRPEGKGELELSEKDIELIRKIRILKGEDGKSVAINKKTGKPVTFKPKKEVKAPKEIDESLLPKNIYDSKKPLFHNNTNVDFKDGKLLGVDTKKLQLFYAELGSIFIEIKNFVYKNRDYPGLDDSTMRGIKALDPDAASPYFVGVGIDKAYKGVNIATPYKAVFLNPAAFDDAGGYESNRGLAAAYFKTMLHELSHTRNRIGGGVEAHGAEFRNSQDQINLLFDDRGSREFYLSVILEAINRFELKNIKSIEEKFNELKTVNVRESLDKHENSRLLSRRAKDERDKKSVGSGRDSSKRVGGSGQPKGVSKRSGRTKADKGPELSDAARREDAAAKAKRRLANKRARLLPFIESEAEFNRLFKKFNRPGLNNLIFRIKNLITPNRQGKTKLSSSQRKLLFKALPLRALQKLLPKTMIGDTTIPIKLGFLSSTIDTANVAIPSMRAQIIGEATPGLESLKRLAELHGYEEVRKLARVMIRSTSLNENPATTKGYKNLKVIDPELNTAFRELKPIAKVAYKQINDFLKKQIRGYKRDMINMATKYLESSKPDDKELIKGAVKNIEKLFKEIEQYDPYFMLKRFGDYWVEIYKNNDSQRAFFTFDNEVDRDRFVSEFIEDQLGQDSSLEERDIYREEEVLTGNQFLLEVLNDPNKNPSAIIEQFKDLVDSMLNNPKYQNMQKMTQGAVGDPETSVSPKFEELGKALKDRIDQLGYLIAPSGSLKKSFLHRGNIIGSETDLIRVFSDYAMRVSYQRSRFKYSPVLYEDIGNSVREHRGLPEGPTKDITGEILFEVQDRLDQILSLTPQTGWHQVSNSITNLAFYWFLTAPASAFVNLTGGYMLGIPNISSRFGPAATMAKLSEHSAKLGFDPTLFLTFDQSIPGGINVPFTSGTLPFTSIPVRELVPYVGIRFVAPFEKYKDRLNFAQQKMLDEMGVELDNSLTYDTANLAEKPAALYSSAFEKTTRLLAALFHNSERYIRTVLALTAFDLEYAKRGKQLVGNERFDETMRDGVLIDDAFNSALKVARDSSYESLGDYTRASQPPILVNPSARVILQFKKFALHHTFEQLYNIATSFNQLNNMTPEQQGRILAKQGRTPEEIEQYKEIYRGDLAKDVREARHRIVFSWGLAGLLAGVKGLPIYSIVVGMFYLTGLFGDDDDEPDYKDFDSWFYNKAQIELGDIGVPPSVRKTLAELATTGLLEKAGLGVSERISLDIASMWVRFESPRGDLEDQLKDQVWANLGPTVALASDAVGSYKHFQNGDILKGIESLLPAFAKYPTSAYRYATEGLTIGNPRTGLTLKEAEDFSYGELILKSLGVNPTDVAAKQRRAYASFEQARKIERDRYNLLAKHTMSVSTENYDFQKELVGTELNSIGLPEDAFVLDGKIGEFNDKYIEFGITHGNLADSIDATLKTKEEKQLNDGVQERLRNYINAEQIGGKSK